MGILAYGHIGRETARMAKALGMRVLVATRKGEKAAIGGYLVEGTGDHEGGELEFHILPV
jgi:phosphoglycerate dehydrogenase-like enzyme